MHPNPKTMTVGNLALADSHVMENQPPNQKTALRDFFGNREGIREIWASKDVKALRKITIVPENCEGLTTWHKVYNDLGNVIAEHDADDRLVREYQYNNRHLLSKITFHNDDGPNTQETRSYDKNGNLTTLIDQEGKPTTYTYDKENQQLKATFAGETTEKVYDSIGNMIAFISPEGATGGKFAGKKKEYQYDAHNRLIEVKEDALDDGARLVTRYEYDKNDNLRHIYDPQNNHVEYLYNDLNRKIQHIQHKSTGNLVTQFGYDGVGNVTSVTDPKGQVFEYEYDLLNRRTDANYPDVPSPLLKLATLGFDYDENNNLTEVVETKYKPDDEQFIDTISNSYDSFDRLDDSTRRGLVIDYAYDHNGNRVSVSTANGAVSYSYTLRNWIKTTEHGGATTTYGYLSDGKFDTITYPNGTDVKYTYHATNRVKSIEHKNGTGVFARYAYTYDKNGNRMSQEEVNAGVTETTSYQYDPMNRMKSFTIVGAAGSMHRKEYTYEGYNRKTERVLTNNAEVESKTFEYDETNWLTKVTGVAAGETYAVDYSFDANGNTLSKVDSRTPDQPLVFAYDARDKLTHVVRGPAGSETILGQFDYNFEGDRIRHRFSDRGDVDYYYDDGAVLEEHNAADDSLLVFYQYAERLIALAQPSGKQYYHHDGLGSTIGLTDGVGAVQKTYQLDPWGNIRAESGVSDNRHIFTGKEHDPNTGLVYFGARYYDPEIGRFITQDSYLGESNEPPSLHRYLYAYSNPTVYWDPTGNAVDRFGGQSVPDPETSDARSTVVTGEEEEKALEQEAKRIEEKRKVKQPSITAEPRDGSKTVVRHRLPEMSKPTDTLYVPEGVIHKQYRAAMKEASDPHNTFLQRAGSLILGTLAGPLALAEEYLSRPAANAPNTMARSGTAIGENAARLEIHLERGETDEAVVDTLRIVESTAEGVEAGLTMAAPLNLRKPKVQTKFKTPSTKPPAKPAPVVTNAGAGRGTTGLIDDVTVISHGKVIGRGTVDVRGTVKGIRSGKINPRDVFENREGLLPSKPSGYYQEFVHPTHGVSGVGPQRIIQGQGGELFYTPDHYNSFIPLN